MCRGATNLLVPGLSALLNHAQNAAPWEANDAQSMSWVSNEDYFDEGGLVSFTA